VKKGKQGPPALKAAELCGGGMAKTNKKNPKKQNKQTPVCLHGQGKRRPELVLLTAKADL